MTQKAEVRGDQLAQMTAEISRRTDRIAPVNERELRESGGGRGASSPAMDSACVSAMSNAAVSGVRCDPGPHGETH